MSTPGTNTRTAILDAARRLLEARGYHGIGLDAIACEAGFSRQAVYLHFESKAGLLLALVEYVDSSHGIARRITRLLHAGSGSALLDAIVLHAATYTPLVHRTATVLDVARRTDPDAEAAWQNRMAHRYEVTRQLVEHLAAEGMLAPGWSPRAAIDMLWTLTSIRVWEDLVVARGWSKRQYTRHLRSVLRASLLVRQPAAAARKRARRSK
jgi:AcrR family transcriptional regulator